MKKLLIGTTNPSKFKTMASQLEGLPVDIVSPIDLGLRITAPEDDRTADGNALQKARAWHEATGLPVVTEDSGLLFLDLPPDHPDQPGVWVRRAAGHEMTDEEMFEWFSALAHRHGGKLRAVWQDAWCLMRDGEHYAIYTDSPEELEPWAFWMVDTPVHDEDLPGWPLERIIIRSEQNTPGSKWHRERFRAWLTEQITSL